MYEKASVYPYPSCCGRLFLAQQKTFLPATPQDVVMYQVNPRVFASRQSLKAVTQHLDSIKALGANTIWVMPVFPIGTTKSKNSPYSISDYKAVAPEFGTIDDYKQLVAQAHRRGMAVIQDWVANHTSWDHPWIKAHPDWYTHDATTDTIICPQGPMGLDRCGRPQLRQSGTPHSHDRRDAVLDRAGRHRRFPL